MTNKNSTNRSYSLLCFEDERDIAGLLKLVLEGAETIMVTIVTNKNDFADKLSKKLPDALFLDMMQLTTDMVNIVRDLRKTEELDSIPLLLLMGTGKGNKMNVEMHLKKGSQRVMVPIDLREIPEKLAEYWRNTTR